MIFCLGMRVPDGLVGIADTRVTSGAECITAQKVSVYEFDGQAFFLMTSGLRFVCQRFVAALPQSAGRTSRC